MWRFGILPPLDDGKLRLSQSRLMKAGSKNRNLSRDVYMIDGSTKVLQPTRVVPLGSILYQSGDLTVMKALV
jgi:hypothetical protein